MQQPELEQVCQNILSGARTELCLRMRFLSLPLCSFSFALNDQLPLPATDGLTLYAPSRWLLQSFRTSKTAVNRAYLHSTLHGIFRHLAGGVGQNPDWWGLACDIAVESVVDGLNLPCVRFPQSWLRQQTYARLKKALRVLTAEGVAHTLPQWELSARDRLALAQEFTVDDHRFWPKPDESPRSPQMQMLQNRWDKAAGRVQTELETFAAKQAEGAGGMLEQLRAQTRERADYKALLRRFAVWREELHADDSGFDTGMYAYGLSLYGNLPLLEPLETREARRIEELVLALDTSMSTSGKMVQRFLDETFSALLEQGSFFDHARVHLLQADEQVKQHLVLSSREDIRAAMQDFQLEGGGGTDFRPVFAYIREQQKQRKIGKIRGLIYYTDGEGIYPAARPPYDTAFVFAREGEGRKKAPRWAITLMLDDGEEFE